MVMELDRMEWHLNVSRKWYGPHYKTISIKYEIQFRLHFWRGFKMDVQLILVLLNSIFVSLPGRSTDGRGMNFNWKTVMDWHWIGWDDEKRLCERSIPLCWMIGNRAPGRRSLNSGLNRPHKNGT